MKKIILLILVNFYLLQFLYSNNLTADSILIEVDNNLYTITAKFDAEMNIKYNDGRVEIKKLKITSSGKEKSFSEFYYPNKDKGLKYLRINDKLWMYHPEAEKIITISGHQLRQSANGSDFSYEDLLERSKKLIEYYTPQIVSEDEKIYVLDLTAKKKDITYYRRKLWINKETMLPEKEEYYAKTGKLFKVFENFEIKKFKNRYYPTHIRVKDVIKNQSQTDLYFKELNFDIKLSDDEFSQNRLK